MINSEKTIFNFLRTKPDLFKFVPPTFFQNESIKLVYKITTKFYKKTSNVPSCKQICLLLEGDDTLDIDSEMVERIFDENLEDLDLNDLEIEVQTWIEYNTLINSLQDSAVLINKTEINSSNITDVKTQIKDLILNRNSLSLDFDMGLDFYDVKSHVQNPEDTFSCGYPWIDKCMGGGYKKKRLYVFMGPQKIGKSIWLSNMAINGVRLGYNTALVSLEMGSDEFIKRVGANALNIRMSEYDTISRDEEFMERALNKFKKGNGRSLVEPGKFVIQEFGASTLSVLDLEEYLKQTEQKLGVKLQLVVVDYINIMKNWRNQNSENTYMKIKQISEDLRAMAKRNEWVIVSATQTNRLEDESKILSKNNISESIGLISTVDALFGINQDSIDKLSNRYYINDVALRSAPSLGEKKEFKIEYDYMRLTETLEQPIVFAEESIFSDENHRNKKEQKYKEIVHKKSNVLGSNSNSPTPKNFFDE